MSRPRLSSLPNGLVLVLLAGGAANAQTTERVSVSTSGAQGDAGSLHSTSITPDGRYVAFQSDAGNLVPGDTNGARDIFVRDRVGGTTTRVSVSSAGGQSNDFSFHPSISADGRYVAFDSYASNLVAGDTNNRSDVFLHDRITGVTTRRSVSSSGVQGNSDSVSPFVSADGRWLAFVSAATNIVPLPNNNSQHVFLQELSTGVTTLMTPGFPSGLETGSSYDPSLSADGRFLAFTSTSNNLLAAQTSGFYDVYVKDRVLGTIVAVGVSPSGAGGNGYSQYPMISANGRVVAFQSDSTNLIAGDTNSMTDVFVRDLDLGVTERVSVSSTGAEADAGAGGTGQTPGLSSDGRYVAFSSIASNLVATPPGFTAIYLRDRALGTTSLVSVSATSAIPNNTSLQPVMSSDGRFVVFQSLADNLVANDTNANYDVFVRGPLSTPWTNLGFGLAGSGGVPSLLGTGTLVAGSPGSVDLMSARASSPAILFLSLASAPSKVQCGTLIPLPFAATLTFVSDPLGGVVLGWAAWPATLSGQSLFFQYVIPDPVAICGVAFSNGLRGDAP